MTTRSLHHHHHLIVVKQTIQFPKDEVGMSQKLIDRTTGRHRPQDKKIKSGHPSPSFLTENR